MKFTRRKVIRDLALVSGGLLYPKVAFPLVASAMRKSSRSNAITMSSLISNLGLTGNLSVLLDAGDSASYTSGQTWADLSGNSNHFYLGATSASNTDDPTFAGSAGGKSSSEFFSLNGSQFLSSAGTPTWHQGFHKAGSKFTIVAVVYVNSLANTNWLVTCLPFTETGFYGFKTHVLMAGNLRLRICNSGSVLTCTSTGAVATGSWNFLAVSFNASGGSTGSLFAINGATETFDGTITSPGTTNPSYTPCIGSTANPSGATNICPSGTNFASVMVWSTNLSAANLTSLYSSIRSRRFISMP